MNDEQIRNIYTEGNALSHTDGLRRVYEAGQRHDAWVIEDRRRLEDERVASAQNDINERARADSEKAAADAKLTPTQRQLAKDQAAAEETRLADAAKLADEKKKADDALAAEDAKREAARIAALKPDPLIATSGTAAVPTQAQITAARAAALKAGKADGLNAQQLITVQEEAEANLVARMSRGQPVNA